MLLYTISVTTGGASSYGCATSFILLLLGHPLDVVVVALVAHSRRAWKHLDERGATISRVDYFNLVALANAIRNLSAQFGSILSAKP